MNVESVLDGERGRIWRNLFESMQREIYAHVLFIQNVFALYSEARDIGNTSNILSISLVYPR
jgi:hypothetical protein